MTALQGDNDTARTLVRAQTALDSYLDQGSWEEAATAAGYTNRGTAYRSVMRLLGNQVSESAAKLREESNARHASKIAMLEDVIYDLERPLLERLRAVDAHTRAEARHARLNGLDAPVQVAISAGVQAELADALAELEDVLELTEQPDGTYAQDPEA